MIVCICKVVSDRTIKTSIAAGAETIDDVGHACRAGTGCGACRPMIAALLLEAESCAGKCADCTGPSRTSFRGATPPRPAEPCEPPMVPSPYLTTEKAA